MKHSSLYILLLLLTFSCSEQPKTNTPSIDEEVKPKNQTLEQMVERHIKSCLSIPATEHFSYKIYKEQLDGDDKLDAIIAVNRLEYALLEAEKAPNSAKQAEIGFTGNYNYVFYYDGERNQISPPIMISSSPHSKLTVKFENLFSEGFKDIIVDYKIRNSAFRDVFTVTNHVPMQVFQWKIYDRLGEKDPEATYFEYGEGSYSLAKDILIYNGTLENADQGKDIYNFEPKISKKGNLLYRFFYYDQLGKYCIKK